MMWRGEPTPEEQEKWDLAQIRQQPPRLFAKPIGSVMKKLLAERDYAATQSSSNLLDAWQEAAGTRYLTSTRPGKVTRGVLQVEVASSVILQELHFEKSRILKVLVEKLPEFKLTDIRFRVKPMG
jgi:hypothetical protein